MSTLVIAGVVVGDPIGRGATAVVHRGHLVGDERPVAVKVARTDTPEVAARFGHEAAVLRRLATGAVPGVPRLVEHTAAPVDGRAVTVLVLEPAGHGSLADIVDTRTGTGTGASARPPERAPSRVGTANAPRSLFADLAAVLADLHRAGVVHGDVAPANIVLLEGGHGMFVDFGSAVVDGVPPPGPVAATEPFAAPELGRGIAPGTVATAAADVYALGMTMVHALLPQAATLAAAGDLDAAHAALTAGGCRRPLADVLLLAIDPLPQHRPSARELHALLLHAGPAVIDQGPASSSSGTTDLTSGTPPPDADTSPEAVTVELGPRPPRRPPAPIAGPPRRRAAAASAAVAAVAAVAGIALLGFGLHGVTANDSPSAPDPVDRAVPAVAQPAAAQPAVAHHGTDGATCPTIETFAPTATPTVLSADVDGSGCPALIGWDPARAEAVVRTSAWTRRFRIGVAGDALVVGDWDGDGRATPALYRPDTGDVFTFDRWAEPDQPDPIVDGQTTGAPGGRPVVRHRDGRDTIAIEPTPP